MFLVEMAFKYYERGEAETTCQTFRQDGNCV